MRTTYPRGSEWRKWDLHLHAPGTKLNDQFNSTDGTDVWDAYCQRLHDSDVQAFGITDYFSADAYFNTRDKYHERYPNSAKVLFPNIELRTNDVVNRQQEEVNIHLLFNPFRPNHPEKIRTFLHALKTNKTDNSSRHVTASELRSSDDYAAPTTTRAFILEALKDTYGNDDEVLECVLKITAANNDGIRPERGKQRKLQLTDELDKFSDAFFGNVGNVDYFLRTDRSEDKTEYTHPKPVLSGCDAHSLADLDARLGQIVSDPTSGIVLAPTWIKADVTYEGLKQIIFEPQNRVFLGPEPDIERRVRACRTKYIDSLHINGIAGYRQDQHGVWFCDEKILLGKELVAIIGNKGSGKSAITDIIGLLGNSHNQTAKGLSGAKGEELFSFLNKDKFLKGGCAGHFEGTLHWYDGEPDRQLLDAQVATHLPERVEYLPQKYLERICANIADDEFRTTLNAVIFRYVEPPDRYGTTSLDDLVEYRTQQAEADIAQKRQDLHQANARVVSIEKRLTDEYRTALEEKIRLKTEDLEAHAKARPEERQNPETVPGSTSTEMTQIEHLTQQSTQLEGRIAQLSAEQIAISKAVEDLQQLRQAIAREAGALVALEDQHQATLAAADLDFSQIVTVTLNYATLDAQIDQKVLRLKEIRGLLLGEGEITAMDEAARAAATAASLVCQKTTLEQQKDDIVERLAKPAQEYQQYVRDLKLWMDRDKELRGDEQHPGPETLQGLKTELNNVRTSYQQDLAAACAKRDQISREIFTLKRGLTQFYNAIKESIDGAIANCREHLGTYEIAIEAGLRLNPSFVDEFLAFINQNVAGSFRGRDDGRTMLRQCTDTVTDWEAEPQVFTALDAIVNALHMETRHGSSPQTLPRDVFKQMKGQKSVQELYDFLFGFEYLDTKYDLTVDQKDLSELSPGERGGLLLVFYLMLDRQEIPLIIDQPEDNLDNKSVYEILVTFIKQAKKRRQIILVTHNPNLAVVADAEQIIHVSIDKKDGKHDFAFFSGAIEEPHINQAVVDILEGTLPAFDNRRLKYRKQNRRARPGPTTA